MARQSWMGKSLASELILGSIVCARGIRCVKIPTRADKGTMFCFLQGLCLNLAVPFWVALWELTTACSALRLAPGKTIVEWTFLGVCFWRTTTWVIVAVIRAYINVDSPCNSSSLNILMHHLIKSTRQTCIAWSIMEQLFSKCLWIIHLTWSRIDMCKSWFISNW